jgi:hypothetical protein
MAGGVDVEVHGLPKNGGMNSLTGILTVMSYGEKVRVVESTTLCGILCGFSPSSSSSSSSSSYYYYY